MNTTGRILAAFAVATVAGTLLGMLISSPVDSGSERIPGTGDKDDEFLFDNLSGRKSNDTTGDLENQVMQNAGEYEQA